MSHYVVVHVHAFNTSENVLQIFDCVPAGRKLTV